MKTKTLGEQIYSILVALNSVEYDNCGNEKERRGMKEWRSKVLGKDYHCCQKCGEKRKKLEGHHVFNWKDNPEIRRDKYNGVILCKNCHLLFHKTYGKRHTTREQLDEFLMGDSLKEKLNRLTNTI